MSASSLRSFEYLEGLPGTTFNRLYKQPSTALAIFRRMLPHLGKLYIRCRAIGRANNSSQELCDGYAVHQPTYACHRSGGVGAPRRETVYQEAMFHNKSNVQTDNETMQSISLKGCIF